MNRRPTVALITIALSVAAAPAPPAAQGTDDAEVAAVLRDYIGLYRADALPRWRELFVPGFSAAFTNDDGSVTTRTLDEFHERQQKYFATGRAIREELVNPTIERTGRLASVMSGFVLFDGDTRREGRLMLLLIQDRGRFRIQSLVFTYHLDAGGGHR